ncbi:MAG: hypothetical protein Q7S68_06020 [Deltaproteobacteria bacterium]|nr:hypothetical protein [Deltaproteobacteria bacterium]
MNGSTLALGECNSDTTLANAMMHHSADPSATSENTTDTFKTSISDGTVRPIEVYNANKSQTATTGGSAGADTTKNALFTIRKAMDACMATLSGGFSAGNLKDLLDGAAILSVCLAKDSTISSVDPSILSAVAQKAGNVAKKYFQDATTAGKWTSSTAFDAWATSMAEYDSTELDNAINNPANVRGLMDKFADQFKTTGSADAFAKMKQGGDAMGQYLEKFGSTAMTDEQKTAAYKLFENFNFASLGTDATKNQDVGTSMYNQVYSCTGSECTNIANNPSNYAGQMLTCPECLAGSDGLAVAQGRIDNGLLGADFAGMTPCNANADCTGGKTCSTLIGFCVAAGTSAAPGEPGATCAANNECKTNTCTSLKCAFPSGDFAGKGLCGAAGSGAACTLDTDCVSGSTCSSNKCLCVPLFPNSFSTDTNSVTTTTCGGSWSPLNDSTDSITSVVQSGASFTAYTSTSNFSGTITGNNWTMTSPTGSQISSNCTFNQSATYSGTVSSFGCSSYINSMSPVSESVGGSCNTLFGTAINSTCVITWGSPTCTQ